MKSNERGAGLPGSVAKKLRAIQRRAVGFTFLRGVILAGAVLLGTMLTAMLLMALAFWMYAIAVALARVRNILLEREAHTDWVQHAVA